MGIFKGKLIVIDIICGKHTKIHSGNWIKRYCRKHCIKLIKLEKNFTNTARKAFIALSKTLSKSHNVIASEFSLSEKRKRKFVIDGCLYQEDKENETDY